MRQQQVQLAAEESRRRRQPKLQLQPNPRPQPQPKSRTNQAFIFDGRDVIDHAAARKIGFEVWAVGKSSFNAK